MENSLADRAPAKAGDFVRTIALLCAWTVFAGLLVMGVLRIEAPRERAALRSMRNMVEQSVAPGEIVLVDDRLLGWALERSGDGALGQSVWTLGKDVTTDSLLPRLVRERRQEMVVLASPDGVLVHRLDAAGFSVAQEVGWVPWDVKGNGYALMGRGKKRIFFAVVPESPKAAERTKEIR